ncbi:MAG TPA: glutamine synthetase family protein [Opitutaceae bacterium]|jgi:glutamine synthetase|nr:glutamine synthetase family protein [Opitutaceae bacterium]
MPPARIARQIRREPSTRAKVAIADIDGVLRGKYLSRDKFLSAAEGGALGFCDVVFGWDSADRCYDNAKLTGWHKGFPDAQVRLDLGTLRHIPWEDRIPFALGEFVWNGPDGKGAEAPHPLCPRQVLKRVLHRAEQLGVKPMCGMEFEWFNFAESPQSWAAKGHVRPEPITPGMFGYSVLRMQHSREYFRALMEELPEFGVPLEGLHTETGPGVFEAAIAFSGALEAADRAILFKSSAKEIGARFGIMPSFMAKWSQDYPGCSGHIHQSLADPRRGRNLFHDPRGRRGMSRLFESYLAGQLAAMMDFGPLIWPTINSYKRLVDGFWAPVKPTWAVDNRTASFRVIPGSAKSTRLETRCPGSDVNPYLAMAAVIAAGLHGVERKLKLTAPAIHGANAGSEDIPRAPRTLIETTRIFQQSAIARDWLGADFVDHFAATREWEWRQWLDGVTDWELRRYFEII